MPLRGMTVSFLWWFFAAVIGEPKTHSSRTQSGHPGEEGFLTSRAPFGMTVFLFGELL